MQCRRNLHKALGPADPGRRITTRAKKKKRGEDLEFQADLEIQPPVEEPRKGPWMKREVAPRGNEVYRYLTLVKVAASPNLLQCGLSENPICARIRSVSRRLIEKTLAKCGALHLAARIGEQKELKMSALWRISVTRQTSLGPGVRVDFQKGPGIATRRG